MQRQIIVLILSFAILALQSAWGAERGALFKVSGHGHTMYLFGTMHVGQPAFYPLEPRIAEAVAKASVLALEVDPLGDPAVIAAAMQGQAMLGPQEPGYKGRGKAFAERLERVSTKAGVNLAALERFKPWLIATILGLSDFAALGYQPALAVEIHLSQLARTNKVPVIELESMVGQLSMFNRLSNEEQWQFLEEGVALMETGKQRGDVRQIVDAWAGADKAALEVIAARLESEKGVAARFMQKVMLEERNGPMADKLALLLAKQDNSVAAVGVLHLIGKHSVAAKLGARGLKVERIY